MATVIFKPTEACNARCIYCDVVKKRARLPKKMTLETLELFFQRVNEFLLERPHEDMEIIWHGGEPLLLGPGYFERALEYQGKHCSGTVTRIRHSIQSNLTLLSREFLGIMKSLGIRTIGTSYDPIGNIRGLGKNRDSMTYNKRFMDAICLLAEEGFGWGVIYVVTKQSLERPLEIFNFLANLTPRGGLRLNPVLVYGSGLGHIKISPAEYVEFLGAIFPSWWRNRGDLGPIEPFSSAVRNLVDGHKSLVCADSGACAYTHVNVQPDGRVSHCGRSADWGLLDYGFIFQKSFSQIFSDPQREIILRRNAVLPETECKECRFWDICHGGCPLDAWSTAGSFLHKSEWCHAKKVLIEKYVEPAINSGPVMGVGPVPQSDRRLDPSTSLEVGRTFWLAEETEDDEKARWINPTGGLGDALMVSSVLKQVSERFPSRKFNLVERTKYREILQGHPAIGRIGYPPPGTRFIRTDYWGHDDYLLPGARAYQILARIFGLEPPVEEKLYVPWEITHDPVLMGRIPWGRFNVLICQSSDSPRKQMAVTRWEMLVSLLKMEEVGVVQAGKLRDRYVRGAYSLLGMTTPRQLVGLVRHFDAVITSDNFVMHAAQLCGVPAVILWGPTDHRVYGYHGQIHLRARMGCDDYPGGCIKTTHPDAFRTSCPNGSAHCMNAIELETIHSAVTSLLKEGPSGIVVREP